MSKNVDERVVQMQFNNNQFESGVQKTLSTIDKLKKSLTFDKSVKSLGSLGTAAKGLSSMGLGGLASSVSSIASKFSALGVIGVTALANIANSALNAGKIFVKSLTVDPLKDGMSEYEKKINSIAVILTNTEKKGTTLDEINKALKELNDYSDLTIYNFGAMADSIGKFTAKGVDLKPAVASVKGIANLGAATGSTAEQVKGAMYQISQAIGTGLKSMDYMSIENANLSGTLLEDRLKEKAKALGTWTKAEEAAFKEGKSFRQTLESGWVTGKVLQGVLTDLGNDKALTTKAGEVRTLTSLLSTMKESVASGWAQTWETIFGNKDEATKLFTGLNKSFSAMIAPMTDARNEMFAFWKEFGGRDVLLETLANILNKIDLVLSPIAASFREMFPKEGVAKILRLTNNFKYFIESLTIGIEAMYYIGKISKGFFAALSIGRQILVAIAKNIGYLIKKLKPAGKEFRDLLARVADWVVALDEALKKGDTFNKGFQKVADFIADIINGIGIAFIDLINSFDLFNKADVSGVTTFVEDVQLEFKPLERIGKFFTAAWETIKKIWPPIKNFLKVAWQVIGESFTKLKDFLAKVGGEIGPILKNLTKEDIMKIFEGGLLSAILIGVLKIVSIIKGFAESAGTFVKGVTGIFDGVRGSLEAYQNNLKADVLKKIATAVAILAASIFLLSIIKPDNLKGSLAAVTLLITELFVAMISFEKIAGKEGFQTIRKVSTAMLLLAVAILILTFAVKKLGRMELEQMGQGLLGVAAILISFGIFLKVGNFDGAGFIKQAASLLIMAIAIGALAGAVRAFGNMDPDVLVQGMFTIGSILVGFAGITQIINKDGNMIKAGLGILMISAAMGKLTKAITVLGEMKPAVLEQGLVGLGVSLGIIATALFYFPKDMVKSGAGFAALAMGVIVLANALVIMGTMDPVRLTQGLLALGISLGIIVALMGIMEGTIGGAIAILIVSAALFGLAVVLGMLSIIPIEALTKSLMAVAVVLGILGLAAVILQPFVGAMALLGGALIVMGIGLAAVGGGMFLLSLGLAALTVTIVPGVPALLLLLGTLVGLVLVAPGMFVLSVAIIAFAASLVILGAALVLLGAGALIGGIGFLIGGIGLIVLAAGLTAMGEVDMTKLSNITDYAGDLLKAAVKIGLAGPGLMAGGKGLWDFGNGAVKTGEGLALINDNLMEVVNKLKEVPGDIKTTGTIIVSALWFMLMEMNGLLIQEQSTIVKIIRETIKESLITINDKRSEWVDSGENLVDGFIEGIRSKVSLAAQAAGAMATAALRSANQNLDINSPSGAFEDVGMNSDKGLAKGLIKYAYLAEKAAITLGERTLTPVMSMAGASSYGGSIRSYGQEPLLSSISRTLQNGSQINPTPEPVQSSMDLSGILTIQVTNDKGEIIGIATKAIKDLLRRESR